MSTPQNPYEPNSGSGNQNPNNQPPSAPQFSAPQNSNQQDSDQPTGDQQNGNQAPQYGAPGGNEPTQAYDATQQYNSQSDGSQPQYGSQPNYGAPQNDNAGQGYDPNQYGIDQNQGGYGQNQGYDANQGYDPNQGGYDANQYGQQPAYAGAEGGSDQFVPANPNAAYGSYPAGTMGGNTSKNIWGILALIGGIVGIVLAFVFGGGFLFAVAAIIFGFVGLGAVKKGLATNRGMNLWGVILGFVGAALSIVVVILLIIGVGFLANEGSKQIESFSPTAPAPVDPSDPGFESPPADSDGSEAAPAPVEGGEVEIGTDITAAVSVKTGTAGEFAIGAESTNGEIAVVSMTIKNNSSSDLDLSTNATLSADNGGGATYEDVFDGDKYKGILAFADPIPAGGESTLEFAFGVPAAELDQLHLQLSLYDDLGAGTEFEFSKTA